MSSGKWSRKKKIIAAVIALVLISAIVVGVIYGVSYSRRGSVIVVPVSELNYGPSGEEMNSIDGTVTVGASQSVYAGGDRAVTEILVSEGQKVKKGTVIARYDSASARSALETKNKDIASIKSQIGTAQATLNALNNVTVYTEPKPEEPKEEDEDPDGKQDGSAKPKEDAGDIKDKPGTIENRVTERLPEAGEPVTKDVTTHTNQQTTQPQTQPQTTTQTGQGSGTQSGQTTQPQDQNQTQTQTQTTTQPQNTGPIYVDASGNKYTSAELARAKNTARGNIRRLNSDLEKAQLEAQRAQRDIDSCDIKATMKGVVTKAGSPEASSTVSYDTDTDDSDDVDESDDEELWDDEMDEFDDEEDMDANVLVRISEGDDLYIKSYINEWSVTDMPTGSLIYMTSWESGGYGAAEIIDISPFVSEGISENYSSLGVTASYYPMVARITEGKENFRSGESVEVSLTKPEGYTDESMIVEEEDLMVEEADIATPGDAEGEDAVIYLWKAFILNENGKKYVYKRVKGGRLKKSRIITDGQESETYRVTGGLKDEEYIAFPYGKNVKDGAKTRKGSVEDLYTE